MLRFFRVIRQNLLMENKNAKYFKYAIGEVLLVVIGILIAVNINNWNDRRADNALETKYLLGIITDIEGNYTRMQEVIDLNASAAQSGNYILNHFKNKTQKVDSTLMIHLGNLIPDSHFQERDIVFEDLKSSGRLNILSNDNLRFKIQEYYHHNERVSSVVNSNGNTKNDVLNLIGIGIDINSILAMASLSYANSDGIVEIDSFQFDFFYRPITDPVITQFIEQTSMVIILAQLNIYRSNMGIEMGEALKSDINKYLNYDQ